MTREEKETYIRDYLTGELAGEERVAFDRWLREDEEARRLFRREARYFRRIRWAERWRRLDEGKAERQTMRRVHRRRLVVWVRYAAAVLVVAVAGLVVWQWRHDGRPKAPLAVVPSFGDKVPVLTLDDGEQIHLFARDTAVLRSTGAADIRLADSGRLEYTGRQADTATVPMRYNTLTVPRGCEFNVTLADGSRVWLNAGSSLRYPEAFVGGQREVWLAGEGYFEVERNERRPFVVRTEGMDLRVLGTSFDVKAYPDDRMIVTTLVTGKIAQRYAAADTGIVLTPSRQSVYDRESGSLRTREVDPRDALAWREGRIVMKDARLEDIFRELSRWYDFEAVYTNPSLRDMRFYLHTNRYAEIDGILEHLQATRGVRFSRVGNKIYVSR